MFIQTHTTRHKHCDARGHTGARVRQGRERATVSARLTARSLLTGAVPSGAPCN